MPQKNFNILIGFLLLCCVALLGVGFWGVYKTNVYPPDHYIFTQFVASQDPAYLKLVENMDGNYDIVSVVPENGGYLITLKYRGVWRDMWQ